MSDAIRVVVSGTSDIGRTRATNEDNWMTLNVRGADGADTTVLAVADGISGTQGGDRASRWALQTVGDKAVDWIQTGWVRGRFAWLEGVRELFWEVAASFHGTGQAIPDLRRMGTTLTCVIIVEGHLVFGHLGDSRAYLFRAGALRQLTSDHTAAADLVTDGRLSPVDAAHHRSRHVLSRCLSADTGDDPEVGSLAAHDGDLILLCTDGLHHLVSDDEIRDVLAGSRSAGVHAIANDLVARANAHGGTDNITVVLAACLPS
jgi:serine/threonine protein phosphatase PrpC